MHPSPVLIRMYNRYVAGLVDWYPGLYPGAPAAPPPPPPPTYTEAALDALTDAELIALCVAHSITPTTRAANIAAILAAQI